MRERLLGAAIVLVLLGGVAGAMTTDGTSSAAPAAPPRLEAGPVRDRTEWVLRFLNEGMGDDEVGDVFASSFLSAVSAEQLIELADRALRPGGPFTIEAIERETDTEAVLLLRGPTGTGMTMSIAVDGSDPAHRIAGLLFKPLEETRPAP